MTDASAAGFFDAWDTYHKVVAGDYMFHRAIGVEIRAALEARFGGRPFTMLDLGCGDAYALAPLLEEQPPSRYKGVDLSATALKLAARNLESLPCPVELVEADLLSALTEPGAYDVIHSSFAVHHLPTAQKAEFFGRAAERLADGGVLLLIDVVREEDETLPVYLGRYCDWLRGAWLGLAPAERESVCEHLTGNDMPEKYSVLLAQAEAAGLTAAPGGASHKWHRLMTFARA